MKYVLIALAVLFIIGLTKAYYRLKQIVERTEWDLRKVEAKIKEDPLNPHLLCGRGTLYHLRQDFNSANLDYNRALELIDSKGNNKDLVGKIKLNITYTEKPLPWSSGTPKDSSKNFLLYFLIDRLGNKRYNFKH
jgi:hypothetical protein